MNQKNIIKEEIRKVWNENNSKKKRVGNSNDVDSIARAREIISSKDSRDWIYKGGRYLVYLWAKNLENDLLRHYIQEHQPESKPFFYCFDIINQYMTFVGAKIGDMIFESGEGVYKKRAKLNFTSLTFFMVVEGGEDRQFAYDLYGSGVPRDLEKKQSQFQR